jgi:lipopolysaccharide biosynthesis glycosyltransferase
MSSPALGADPIAVLLCADRGYVRQLAVALRSLSDADGSANYRAFILSDDFDDEIRRRLCEACGSNLTLRFMPVSDVALRGVKLDGRIPLATVYPLLAPEVLPRELSRVICIDADVLVRRSLVQIWQADLGEHVLGAVRDAYLPLVGFDLPWRRLGIDPSAAYFNAGVMVIELDGWRDARVSEQALALLREESLPNDEQSALNAVFGGGWRHLAPEWNMQAHHFAGDWGRAWAFEDAAALQCAIADPAVVHFCGGDFGRPWVAGSSHPFRAQWFETLDKTPWAGWRPRRQFLSGALRRVGRARRELLGHAGR